MPFKIIMPPSFVVKENFKTEFSEDFPHGNLVCLPKWKPPLALIFTVIRRNLIGFLTVTIGKSILKQFGIENFILIKFHLKQVVKYEKQKESNYIVNFKVVL